MAVMKTGGNMNLFLIIILFFIIVSLTIIVVTWIICNAYVKVQRGRNETNEKIANILANSKKNFSFDNGNISSKSEGKSKIISYNRKSKMFSVLSSFYTKTLSIINAKKGESDK